ncbi:Xanthine dehydrogenase [Holothuria leucospilota]|uniref:Xanthine dehydrogenase n=1 Tax=Holothuria leucospilota TaxID=206669 RepID=A0A9Q1C7D0_HOLLE|nr:Xanthine dehydrogenase [Holothuria leucospilota]
MFVLEDHRITPEGHFLTTGPGTYKIPGFANIPAKFSVSLLTNASNPRAIFSSKGIGEPSLILGTSVFLAIKDAIIAAREESGHSKDFRLDSPATSERIRLACQDKFTQMVCYVRYLLLT